MLYITTVFDDFLIQYFGVPYPANFVPSNKAMIVTNRFDNCWHIFLFLSSFHKASSWIAMNAGSL